MPKAIISKCGYLQRVDPSTETASEWGLVMLFIPLHTTTVDSSSLPWTKPWLREEKRAVDTVDRVLGSNGEICLLGATVCAAGTYAESRGVSGAHFEMKVAGLQEVLTLRAPNCEERASWLTGFNMQISCTDFHVVIVF